MCKPMLVTLPLVLLLLDYWPLQRAESAGKLVLEKLPLLALSGAGCVITLLAQSGAIQSTEKNSLPLRFANALVTCVVYLGQMVWPVGWPCFIPIRRRVRRHGKWGWPGRRWPAFQWLRGKSGGGSRGC